MRKQRSVLDNVGGLPPCCPLQKGRSLPGSWAAWALRAGTSGTAAPPAPSRALGGPQHPIGRGGRVGGAGRRGPRRRPGPLFRGGGGTDFSPRRGAAPPTPPASCSLRRQRRCHPRTWGERSHGARGPGRQRGAPGPAWGAPSWPLRRLGHNLQPTEWASQSLIVPPPNRPPSSLNHGPHPPPPAHASNLPAAHRTRLCPSRVPPAPACHPRVSPASMARGF